MARCRRVARTETSLSNCGKQLRVTALPCAFLLPLFYLYFDLIFQQISNPKYVTSFNETCS
jgi:hypothetical protein